MKTRKKRKGQVNKERRRARQVKEGRTGGRKEGRKEVEVYKSLIKSEGREGRDGRGGREGRQR